jgi:hypothetical protein
MDCMGAQREPVRENAQVNRSTANVGTWRVHGVFADSAKSQIIL